MLLCQCEAVYIGINEGSFKNKNGEEIHYRKAKFSIRDSADVFALSVSQDCDISMLQPYEDASLIIDFNYSDKNGIWSGRLLSADSKPF